MDSVCKRSYIGEHKLDKQIKYSIVISYQLSIQPDLYNFYNELLLPIVGALI